MAVQREPRLEGQIRPGDIVDNCRIEALLGCGGFGAVYRAQHLTLDEPRAMKFMLEAPDASDELKRRFLAEARHTARLKHPHIVIVHNVSEHRGMAFIHMEFVDGDALRARTKRGPLPRVETLEILRKVLQALAFAHRHGLVHRDVKPDNVMLGAADALKLVDFGLSLNTDMCTSRITLDSRRPMGTPLYMAPEQWRSATVGPAADVWSVGVMAYELLSRSMPFGGGSLLEVMESITREPHAPLEDRAARIPPAIARWVDRMLAKQVHDRFPSAQEALDTLERILSETSSGPVARPGEARRATVMAPLGALPDGIAAMPTDEAASPGAQEHLYSRGADGATMTLVPAATFVMGDDDGEGDAQPAHEVSLASFLIDLQPVSRAQYAAFLRLWGSDRDDDGHALLDPDMAGIERMGAYWEPTGAPGEPVTGITWYGAAAYARWAGATLPSEAQFELLFDNLAAGDSSGTTFKGLIGAIRHWCHDTYDERYYTDAPGDDPVNLEDGPFASIRGLSRAMDPASWTRSLRHFETRRLPSPDLGFRCAVAVAGAGQSTDEPTRGRAANARAEPVAGNSSDQEPPNASQHPRERRRPGGKERRNP